MKFEHANWNLIPEHMRGAVERWINNGIAPGSFLTAVLCNDLKEAFGRADDINGPRVGDYIRFFYSDAPAGCWGSPAKFAEWERRGGLLGHEASDAA